MKLFFFCIILFSLSVLKVECLKMKMQMTISKKFEEMVSKVKKAIENEWGYYDNNDNKLKAKIKNEFNLSNISKNWTDIISTIVKNEEDILTKQKKNEKEILKENSFLNNIKAKDIHNLREFETNKNKFSNDENQFNKLDVNNHINYEFKNMIHDINANLIPLLQKEIEKIRRLNQNAKIKFQKINNELNNLTQAINVSQSILDSYKLNNKIEEKEKDYLRSLGIEYTNEFFSYHNINIEKENMDAIKNHTIYYALLEKEKAKELELNKTELELKQKITNIQNEIMKYEKKKRQYNVLEKD